MKLPSLGVIIFLLMFGFWLFIFIKEVAAPPCEETGDCICEITCDEAYHDIIDFSVKEYLKKCKEDTSYPCYEKRDTTFCEKCVLKEWTNECTEKCTCLVVEYSELCEKITDSGIFDRNCMQEVEDDPTLIEVEDMEAYLKVCRNDKLRAELIWRTECENRPCVAARETTPCELGNIRWIEECTQYKEECKEKCENITTQLGPYLKCSDGFKDCTLKYENHTSEECREHCEPTEECETTNCRIKKLTDLSCERLISGLDLDNSVSNICIKNDEFFFDDDPEHPFLCKHISNEFIFESMKEKGCITTENG